MDTRRALGLVLLVVLVAGATPALAAIASYSVPVTGEVPVTTDQTPQISVAAPNTADVNLRDVWAGNELDIRTSQGNITVSGDPGASARIAVDAIGGTQTQVTEIDAGSDWLNLNPADKQRVDVRGDADTLAFRSLAADDGTTDIQLGGPQGGTAELRLYGLSANTAYGLYDASRDEVLGNFTTDNSGASGAFPVDLPDGTHALELRTADSFAAPTVSDLAPTGTVTDRPSELSANVTATAWNATVTFTLAGDTVATKTVGANGTVTADITGAVDRLGTYDYTVTITDGVGQTASASASFETPSSIDLREEHAPTQNITNATATLRFYSADGDIAVTRPVDDGTVNMTGLPDSAFVVFAESPNHYARTIYIDSIFQQENMFLLNSTVFPRSQNEAVRSRFIFEDFTGEFSQSESTVQIQRALDVNNDSTADWLTVAGDYWGASAEFEQVLERGARYRIIVVNQETGRRYNAGPHIPTEELTQTVRIAGVTENVTEAGGVTALAELNNSTIELAYDDPQNATDELRVTVAPRGGGTPIYNQTVAGPLGTFGTTISLNDSQAEQDWVVTFDAGDRHRSVIPVGSGAVGLPVAVPGWLLTLLLSMAVTFVGALYGPRTALLGAWAMVFVAAGAAMFGWAFSGAAVVVAALIAAGMTVLSVGLP